MRKNVLLIPTIAAILTLTTLATSARALPSELQSPPQPTQSDASDEYFYYYQGKKVPLQPLDSTIGVQFRDGTSSSKQTELLDSVGAFVSVRRRTDLLYPPISLLELEPGQQAQGIREAISALRSNSEVSHASQAFTTGDAITLIPTQDLVARFPANLSSESVEQVANTEGLQVLRDLGWSNNTYLLRVRSGQSLDAANRLFETGRVVYAEPNFVLMQNAEESPKAFPTPDLVQEAQANSMTCPECGWNIEKVRAEEAWQLTSGKPDGGVRVAILDTGVKRAHEDLRDNMWTKGYNALTGDEGPSAGEPSDGCTDGNFHGTAVAGMVAARYGNNLGVVGVARNHAAIVPVKIGYFSGDNCGLTVELIALATGIRWAADNADIINISWETIRTTTEIDEAIEYAMQSGRGGLGTLVVGASGNGNHPWVAYPARWAGVLAVGATNSDDERVDLSNIPCDVQGSVPIIKWCGGSNYGKDLDLVAPGIDLKVPVLSGNGYADKQWGTSFAAPEAAGVAALMLTLNPSLTAGQVADILQRTAAKVGTGIVYDLRPYDGGWNFEMGYGRLDAYSAVKAVSDPPKIHSIKVLLKGVIDAGGSDHSAQVSLILRRQDPNHVTIWGPRTVTTDASGIVQDVVLQGVGLGTYDLCAKPEHHLGMCKSVSLFAGINLPVDFSNGGTSGAWPGDIDTAGEDNVVNALDHGVMLNYFQSHAGEAGSPYDFNRDGILNTVDVLKLRITWRDHPTGDGGARAFGYPFPHGVGGTAAAAAEGSGHADTAVGTLAGAVTIGLPEYSSVVQGYAFDVPVTLNTNGADTTGTTALLRYDPGVLSVQSVTLGSLYSSAVQETADDPVAGVVRMSAYNSSTPFDGAGVFATVRFMPHHGMPTSDVFSALEVWLEGDETYHSVVAQNVTAANQLGTVGTMLFSITGNPRPFNGIELTPGSNSYINSFSEQIEAIVHDPYSQVRSVDFSAYYDGGWHTIGTDNNAADGWSVIWENTGIADQVIQLRATAHLPGTLSYGQTNRNIILDRTVPTYVSSSFSDRSLPESPYLVIVSVSASDGLSGVRRIEMYVNSANDGSASGSWILKGAADNQATATFNWNRPDLAGTYQVAFAIQDNASNWNRWDTPGLPTLTYEVPLHCHSLRTLVNPAGSGTVSVNPPPDCTPSYTCGREVELAAHPNLGYTFANWTGFGILPVWSNPMTLTMDRNRSITANFVSTDTTIPTVAIWLLDRDVGLSWDNNQVNHGGYIVWRSTDPYFQPDDTGAISTALPAGTTSYTHSGAASSGSAWFYLIQGVSGAGARSPVSNRTGAFGFGLVPGAVQGMTPQPE